ncbi:MAG: glycosyltransferase family 4 protein [candidate division Zixibacteria bacterium]|nr:glycosyltransferase family 4 protein [candidate division Zixibacteria bacterium]
MFKRAPFVFEVRDLWPEEIVAVGAIHNKTIIRILEWIEMFLYRRASLIVAVAQGTIDTLVDRGVPREKITLLPNGVLLKRFENADGEKIRKQLKFDGEFLVSYIGTHGMAHKLETVVGAAEKLKHNNRIRFLMVGDGAEKIKLQKLVAEKGLTNMTFVPQIPSSEAPDYYSASDVCLAPLRNVSLFRRNIPSKLYEIMASGKPILLGAQGESQKLVETAKAGMTFEPENEDSLVDRINELFQNRELATRLGMQGREYVAENHQRKDVARRYIECIRTMLEANKR